jgi:hypothetical protein
MNKPSIPSKAEIGHTIRRGLFRSLNAVSPMAGLAARRSLSIIYYHRVLTPGEIEHIVNKNMCTAVESFDEQMRYLSEYCPVVDEARIVRHIERDEPLPEGAVWVTLDDGFEDNIRGALPILDRYRIPATFFISSASVSEPSADEPPLFMTWGQIKDLSDRGYGIGCHTASHRILSRLMPAEIASEVQTSKEAIERRIGRPVVSFAYPHGKGGDCAFRTSVPILKGSGIKIAVTTIGGRNAFKRLGRQALRLRRFGISCGDTLPIFIAKLKLGCFWQR